MTNRVRLLSACVLSALATSIAGIAVAQVATADQQGGNVETIVVTAERRAQAQIDVPASLSVVSSQDLKDRHDINLAEIADTVPNVIITDSALYPGVIIRGVSSQDDFNPGFAPPEAIYVDEVYQGRNRAMNIPLCGISQIEVLRGPQGTLYGKNTIGGAINITTQKPTDEFSASLDAQYGNLDFSQVCGFISGPVDGDKLMVSASGFYRHMDGYIHNIITDTDLDSDNAIDGRVRAIYAPTSHLTFDVSADYLHENNPAAQLTTATIVLPFPPYNATQPYIPGERVMSANGPEVGRREVQGVSARADYDLSGVRLTSISSYRSYQTFDDRDEDGVNLSEGAQFIYVDNAHQVSQELRATSTDDGPFQWIAGLYFYQEQHYNLLDSTFLDEFPTLLLGLPPLPPGYTDVTDITARIGETSYAAYASGTYYFSPDLFFTGGFRYTEDVRHLGFSQGQVEPGVPFSIGALFLAQVPQVYQAASDSVPTGDASLSYKFSDNQVGYIKFSRGYKAGGFNATEVTNPYVPGQSLAFQPEFINNYEIGFKADWWDGRLSLNSDFFYNQYTNKQEAVLTFIPAAHVTIISVKNAASATMYGGEFEATAIPFTGLTLTGTLGLLNGTYSQFIDGTTNYSGSEIEGAAHYTYSFAAQYAQMIPDFYDVTGIARVEVTARDAFWSAPGNSLGDEATASLNARLGLERGNMGLYLWGKNLTNTFELTGYTTYILATGRTVNLPRTFGVELSWKN